MTSCLGDHLETLIVVPHKSLLCFLGRSLRWAYIGISVSWGTREAERCLKADEPNSGFGNPPKGSCIQFCILRVDTYFGRLMCQLSGTLSIGQKQSDVKEASKYDGHGDWLWTRFGFDEIK